MLQKFKERILKSFVFWGCLGPVLLLLTFIVFSIHTSVSSVTPYSWLGFVSSYMLGLFVTAVSMLEIDDLFLEKKEQMQAYKEELTHLQSALRGAQVAKLEEKETLQNEIQRITQNSAEELKALTTAYEKLHTENAEFKNKAHALQTSLESALEDLGKTRQLEYLKQELETKLKEIQTANVPKVIEETDSSVFEHIQQMDEELVAFEQEVVILHEIISKLLTEKKVVRAKRTKKAEEPTLLNELLDYKE
jgi:hypothetical protein